jgi:hypothetical protein
MVVFGGHFFAGNDKFEYLNETWLLDAENLNWHKINCSGEIPSPRYGHSAHILGSRMFIFGGKGPGDTVNKDVYFLDLLEWVWVPVNTISLTPPPRFHSANVHRQFSFHNIYADSSMRLKLSDEKLSFKVDGTVRMCSTIYGFLTQTRLCGRNLVRLASALLRVTVTLSL